MHDSRVTPTNGRVAAAELKGLVEADRFTNGEWRSIRRPVVDLLTEPGGSRSRQVLFGEQVRVFDSHQGMAFVQSGRDGYVGYIEDSALGSATVATHRVIAPSSHLYLEPDMKARDHCWLSHGSTLRIHGHSGEFLRDESGYWIPEQHVAPIEIYAPDTSHIAEMYLGTPYLWGGNSRLGIDCSGLVQAALLACGIPCPGDSDQQSDALGTHVPLHSPARRGDLFFWRGHVAMAISDHDLIHANAHHMAVAVEPIRQALERIASTETGDIIAQKRLQGAAG